MKVRMKVGMSGTHNGEPWPPYGELAEVDDVFGEKLIASGLAEPTTTRSVSPVKETEDETDVAVVEERPASNLSVEARPAITRTQQTPKKRK